MKTLFNPLSAPELKDLLKTLSPLLAASAAIRSKPRGQRPFNICLGGDILVYDARDLFALADAFSVPVRGSISQRFADYRATIVGTKLTAPIPQFASIAKADITCPDSCYRIHLTTPDPEGEEI